MSTILTVGTAVPRISYGLALVIFSRYRLTTLVHAQIRTELGRPRGESLLTLVSLV